MRIAVLVATAALTLLAVPSTAQVRSAPVLRAVTPAPAANAAMLDRGALTERRLLQLAKKNRALEGRVATLEDALRQMRAATEFTCASPTTSRNGRGSEDCSPYACNYLDGRCRTSSVDSSQCAPGFVWDGSSHCTAPPAQAEDDCFIGLFC